MRVIILKEDQLGKFPIMRDGFIWNPIAEKNFWWLPIDAENDLLESEIEFTTEEITLDEPNMFE